MELIAIGIIMGMMGKMLQNQAELMKQIKDMNDRILDKFEVDKGSK